MIPDFMIWIIGCHFGYFLRTDIHTSFIVFNLWPTNCTKVKNPIQDPDIKTCSLIWLVIETLISTVKDRK